MISALREEEIYIFLIDIQGAPIYRVVLNPWRAIFSTLLTKRMFSLCKGRSERLEQP